MPHSQRVRILPEANTAVLFMHGICGSPNHFRQLLPLEDAVPHDWSLYNMVIDGHCKKVEDFGRSSMKKWLTQVRAVFDELCSTHQRVILAGHSMGTLFAIDLALRRPEKVPCIFLLAVPVRVFVKPIAVANILRVGFHLVDENDPVQMSMVHACGIQTTRQFWKYIPWASRMLELLYQGHVIGKQLSALQVPAIAMQSRHDEMVSRRATRLLQKSGKVEVRILDGSTHFYYPPEDREMIVECFQNTLRKFQ